MRTFRSPGGLRSRLAWIALICLFVAGARRGMAGDTNTAVSFVEHTYQQLYRQFQTETNNADMAWQYGRACFDMSTLQKDAAAEARFAEQGIAACRRALALDSNSAPAHYYLGMVIGQLADTKRNLSSLRMVKDVEREFLAARALDNKFDHAGPDRNLGLLYRDAPVIASIGSRAKARQHLEQAVQIAPEFPENQLNLVEVYLKWDYQTEALRQFGELEKMWPEAQKKFTGPVWDLDWMSWTKRFDNMKKKLEKNSKVIESPHSQ